MENPIRQARQEQNYSQQEVADLIGVTLQSIKLYEAGQKTPPQTLYDLLSLTPDDQPSWIRTERSQIHEYLTSTSNRALSGKSNEYAYNLVYFKSQLNKTLPKPKTFNEFIKMYFTTKSFCSKLLMINYSSLDRHVNGFPTPLKEALLEIGLSAWARQMELHIYGK